MNEYNQDTSNIAPKSFITGSCFTRWPRDPFAASCRYYFVFCVFL